MDKFSNKDRSWDDDGQSLVLLNDETDLNAYNSQIFDFFSIYKPDEKHVKISLFPYRKMHLNFGYNQLLILLSAIGVLILSIACINYINLAISNGLARGREFGIKKVNGAKKSNITSQFLSESGLIIIISSIIALVLLHFLTPLFNNLVKSNLDFFSKESIAFSFTCFIVIGLIMTVCISAYPSYFFSKTKTIKILSASKITQGGSITRNIFITFQFAVTIFLIIATISTYKQMNYIRASNWGMSYDNIVKIPATKAIVNNFDTWRNELLKSPNVVSVTAASTFPSSIGNHSTVMWEIDNEIKEDNFKFAMIKPGYVSTFGMSIIEGNDFRENVRTDLENYIINEKAKAALNFKDSPVGETIELWGKKGEIIGVVNDFKNNSFYHKTLPLILNAKPEHSFFIKHIFIKLKTSNQECISHIKKTYSDLESSAPFEYIYLQDYPENRYAIEKRMGRLLGIAAIVAISIACMGLFSIAYSNCRERTKEIGIRKVNGAKIHEVILLLQGGFLKWILLAFIISTPIAYYSINLWLDRFAYKTQLNWWIFVLAGLIAMGVALLTVSWQSWKAAKRNPVESLRYE